MDKKHGKDLLILSLALGIAALLVAFVALRMRASAAFNGPTGAGGVGSGAIAVGPTGNIGIGTTAPGANLTIQQNSNAQNIGGLKLIASGTSDAFSIFEGGDHNSYLWNGGAGGIAMYVASGTQALNIASSGNVGIGTTIPSAKLDVVGPVQVSGSAVTSVIPNSLILSYESGLSQSRIIAIGPNNTSPGTLAFTVANTVGGQQQSMVLSPNGNVGIGTTTPGNTLTIKQNSDSQNTGGLRLYSSAGGDSGTVLLEGGDHNTYFFNMGGGSSGNGMLFYVNGGTNAMNITSAGTVVVGGGSGKITAGTVDPAYTIDGEKYATYVPGMTGQKEETTGVAALREDGDTASFVIDFNQQEKGSDLWLFSKATDLKDHIKDMAVLLTPGFDGTVWYRIDASVMKLTIYGRPRSSGATDLSVSYRLSAPRFDSANWPNTRTDDAPGLIVNQ